MKDRCFNVPAKGGGEIRVRAGKRPTGKALKALQGLFDAAHRFLADRQRAEARSHDKPGIMTAPSIRTARPPAGGRASNASEGSANGGGEE